MSYITISNAIGALGALPSSKLGDSWQCGFSVDPNNNAQVSAATSVLRQAARDVGISVASGGNWTTAEKAAINSWAQGQGATVNYPNAFLIRGGPCAALRAALDAANAPPPPVVVDSPPPPTGTVVIGQPTQTYQPSPQNVTTGYPAPPTIPPAPPPQDKGFVDMMMDLPLAAKIGIGAGVLLLVGLGVYAATSEPEAAAAPAKA